MLVSRRFHQAVINTPLLWSTIIIKNSSNPQNLIARLERACSTPLTIVASIDFPEHNIGLDEIWKALSGGNWRVHMETLIITSLISGREGVLDMNDFPLGPLRSLAAHSPTTLRLIHMPLPTASYFPSSLIKLIIETPLERKYSPIEVTSCLQGCPQLQGLLLSGFVLGPSDATEPDILCNMAQLRKLSVRDVTFSQGVALLHHIRCPHLTSLEFHLDSPDEDSIWHSYGDLSLWQNLDYPRLEHLSFAGVPAVGDILADFLGRLPPSLKSFSINMEKVLFQYRTVVDKLADKRLANFRSRLVRLEARGIPLNGLVDLVERCSSLKQLRVHGESNWTQNNTRYFTDSLKQLVIDVEIVRQ